MNTVCVQCGLVSPADAFPQGHIPMCADCLRKSHQHNAAYNRRKGVKVIERSRRWDAKPNRQTSRKGSAS